MTLILSIRHDNGTVLLADSRISCGAEFITPMCPAKIVRIPYGAIGLAGSNGMTSALRAAVTLVKGDQSDNDAIRHGDIDEEWIFDRIIGPMAEAARSIGLDPTDSDFNADLLIATPHRHFRASTLGSVIEFDEPVAGIGASGIPAAAYAGEHLFQESREGMALAVGSRTMHWVSTFDKSMGYPIDFARVTEDDIVCRIDRWHSYAVSAEAAAAILAPARGAS